MGYIRTKRWGELQVPLGTTGGAAADTDPFGVSVVSATSAEVFTLNAPSYAGQEKTIVITGYSTSALPVVKLCTNAGQSVSFVGASTNLTVIKSAAGRSTIAPTVIQLKANGTTSWIIMNVFPNMGSVTTGSTGVSNSVSLSST